MNGRDVPYGLPGIWFLIIVFLLCYGVMGYLERGTPLDQVKMLSAAEQAENAAGWQALAGR